MTPSDFFPDLFLCSSLHLSMNPSQTSLYTLSFPAGASLGSKPGQVQISESPAVASLPLTVCGVRGSPSLPIPWETPREA